jgi:EAL domain-containing protein (putative c-di-GMP-specific phosphodiesterase class I)
MSGEDVVVGLRARTEEQAARDAALLADASRLLDPFVDAHVAAFYVSLEERPELRQVFERLTPAERERLLDRQGEHVRSLLDPGTTNAAILSRARAVGRIHALAGVEMDWYVDAVADHQRGIFDVLFSEGRSFDLAEFTALLNERFMLDLHGALQGYREVDAEQNHVLLQVNRITAEARTVADLARGVLDVLAGLDGLVVAFVVRPDEHGVFVHEAGAGVGVDEFIERTRRPGALVVTTSTLAAEGQGPAGRAWRSGQVVRSDDYRSDPTTLPWREWAQEWGWRASAAVPLCDSRGEPMALLSLYARWPGYFAYGTRAAMIEQVKQLVERALADLHTTPSVASGVRGYFDRAHHLRLLADGAVEMHYQPVVALTDGRLVKLEGLARLRDGEHVLGPAEFLPTFGEEELLRLFEVGLDLSLTAMARWHAEGVDAGVSVNLPVAAATDLRYVLAVRSALERHRAAPASLTLELLETGDMVGSLAERRAAMDRFKNLGVRLAQDDLGSGYSSLLRLRHFAFDEVKIDKNLVRGTDFSPRTALHFVQPITDIAHSLGLQVVLEGLESDGLTEAAAQLGVDAGQGYAIARPMAADQVVPWARSFRLDLDPAQPVTHLGALAAHIAWEHRVTAVGDIPARQGLLHREACALSAYLTGRPQPQRLHDAHDEVHRSALVGRGSELHRSRWEQLVAMLGEKG